MRTVFLLLLSIAVVPSFGQLSGGYQYKPLQGSKDVPSLPDSIKNKVLKKVDGLAIRENYRDNMPVLKQKLHGEYSGNNGRGFDVYAMKPYNMPCLVPDSSFKSNMPVSGSIIKRSPSVELRKDNAGGANGN